MILWCSVLLINESSFSIWKETVWLLIICFSADTFTLLVGNYGCLSAFSVLTAAITFCICLSDCQNFGLCTHRINLTSKTKCTYFLLTTTAQCSDILSAFNKIKTCKASPENNKIPTPFLNSFDEWLVNLTLDLPRDRSANRTPPTIRPSPHRVRHPLACIIIAPTVPPHHDDP